MSGDEGSAEASSSSPGKTIAAGESSAGPSVPTEGRHGEKSSSVSALEYTALVYVVRKFERSGSSESGRGTFLCRAQPFTYTLHGVC